jgi:hypothetical protein
MSRKTITWIVTGALVAALIAAVGIVSYHIGFNHGNGGIMGMGAQRDSMRGFAFGSGFVRRDAGFPGLGLLAAVLLAGGVGAAIVYLIDPNRHAVRAVAVGSTAGDGATVAGATGADAPGAGAAMPSAGGPLDPQWQQFEQWYRQMHGSGAAQTQAETQAETLPSAPPTTPDTPPQT